MKKMINLAFAYTIAALIFGVFYREFTKYMAFSGRTTLAFTHVHFFVLGTGLFLILTLFGLHTDLTEQKRFGTFLKLYNIALPFMVVMMTVRGIVQVLGTPLSRGADAAISGLAGITHILLTVALVMLFTSMKQMRERHA